MARIKIRRGDIWIVDLEPGYGKEIHKKRPALIISNNRINFITYHVVVIPTSSIVPKLASPEIITLGKIKGFNKESVLLPHLIRSIDQDRLIKKIGKLSQDKMEEVEESLKLILGMIELD